MDEDVEDEDGSHTGTSRSLPPGIDPKQWLLFMRFQKKQEDAEQKRVSRFLPTFVVCEFDFESAFIDKQRKRTTLRTSISSKRASAPPKLQVASDPARSASTAGALHSKLSVATSQSRLPSPTGLKPASKRKASYDDSSDRCVPLAFRSMRAKTSHSSSFVPLIQH